MAQGALGGIVPDELLSDPALKQFMVHRPFVSGLATRSKEAGGGKVSIWIPFDEVEAKFASLTSQEDVAKIRASVIASDKKLGFNQQQENVPSFTRQDFLDNNWSEAQIDAAIQQGKINITQ